MTVAIDEAERRAIVKTLNALTVLQRNDGPGVSAISASMRMTSSIPSTAQHLW